MSTKNSIYVFIYSITVFFFLTFATPVQVEALAGKTPSKKEPRFIITADLDKDTMYGDFEVSVFAEGEWKYAGKLRFGKEIRERKIEFTGLNKLQGAQKIRIKQNGGITAHIDSVLLGGEPPVKIDGRVPYPEITRKIMKKDFDVIIASEAEFDFEFKEGGGQTFVLSARVKPHVYEEYPFQFPRENEYEEVDEKASFYIYEIGSGQGKLSLSGDLDQVSERSLFFKEKSISGSGHPSGYTYGYVKNDDEYLYAAMDFTVDNTSDGGMDHATVHVKTEDGVKEFVVSDDAEKWGASHFLYTGKVHYEHRYYEFKIPLDEIGVKKPGDEVLLAFSAVGSGTIIPAANPITFPDTGVGSTSSQLFGLRSTAGGPNTLCGGGHSIDGGQAAEFGWNDPDDSCGGATNLVMPDNTICSLYATFSPASSGAKTSTFKFKWGACPNGTLTTMDMKGTGTDPLALTVDLPGNGSGRITSTPAGIDCPGICSAVFPDGSDVTLNVTESDPFTGWSGDCAGIWQGSPCIVTMDSHKNVDAWFETAPTPPNNPPTYDGAGSWLLYPADGAAGVPTSLAFGWQVLTDADGNPISYTLLICENFDRTTNTCAAWTEHTARAETGRVFAGLGTLGGVVMIGFVFGGAMRSRRGRAVLLALFVMTAGAGIVSCSSSDSDSDSSSSAPTTCGSAASGQNCLEVGGLSPNTLYGWKIQADDGNGGTTESDTWTFTTGAN